MVFISGVHGVGKSYFCKELRKQCEINYFSASELIELGKKVFFSKDKKVSNIDDNQKYLISAVDELRKQNKEFVLDGHFCLLNQHGEITKITENVFYELQPDLVVLLTEKSQIIHDRRLERDGIEQSIDEIEQFQQAEIIYAMEISEKYQIPIEICKGMNDIYRVINLIIERSK